MSKRTITNAINKMNRGLTLYDEGMEQLASFVANNCTGSLDEVVGEDIDRQDMVLATTEGVSVTPDELIAWMKEYDANSEEE